MNGPAPDLTRNGLLLAGAGLIAALLDYLTSVNAAVLSISVSAVLLGIVMIAIGWWRRARPNRGEKR